MSFLKNFLKTNTRDGESPKGVSSFRNLSEDQLDNHMSIAQTSFDFLFFKGSF